MYKSRPIYGKRRRPEGENGYHLLPRLLIGFFCASAVFLALWPTHPKPPRHPPITADVPTTIEDLAVTLLPEAAASRKKLFTDRILPELGVISQEGRALATQKRGFRVKQRPTARCKPGRTRNEKGECGHWRKPDEPLREEFSR